MTRCLARRAQTAASSGVVVISSMNGPLRFRQRRSAESADMSRVLRKIRALQLRLATPFRQVLWPATARDGGSDPAKILALESDRSEVAGVPAGRPPRDGNRQHDDAKREHREPHEFKHQRVHGNLPKQTARFGGKRLTAC